MLKHISDLDIAGELSLRELATVVAVAEYGGALRAARELGYAQSTVTLHIQNLERSLGRQLFEREGKRLVLTDAGRVAVAEGRALLGAAREMRSRVAGASAEHQADVGIGSVEPLVSCKLPSLLAAHERRFPHVRITMRSGGGAAVREMLVNAVIDFAISAEPAGRHAGLVFRPLFEEHFVVIVPKRHRLAEAKKLRLRDLARETLVLGEETCIYRNLIATAIEDGDVDVFLRSSYGTVMNLPYAVEARLGIAIIPAMATSMVPPTLRAVPLAEPKLSFKVGSLTRRAASESPAARHVRTFLESRLRVTADL